MVEQPKQPQEIPKIQYVISPKNSEDLETYTIQIAKLYDLLSKGNTPASQRLAYAVDIYGNRFYENTLPEFKYWLVIMVALNPFYASVIWGLYLRNHGLPINRLISRIEKELKIAKREIDDEFQDQGQEIFLIDQHPYPYDMPVEEKIKHTLSDFDYRKLPPRGRRLLLRLLEGLKQEYLLTRHQLALGEWMNHINDRIDEILGSLDN